MTEWWNPKQKTTRFGVPVNLDTHHELLIHTSFFSGSIPIVHVQEKTPIPTSFYIINKLFFCPICGDVWMRFCYSPHPTYTLPSPNWVGMASLCQIHGGGIVSNYILPELLPLPLLRHDAELLIRRLYANT